MRYSVKMESGKPLIVCHDEPARSGFVLVYSQTEEHSEASKEYIKALKAPSTKEERIAAFNGLSRYMSHCAYIESITSESNAS